MSLILKQKICKIFFGFDSSSTKLRRIKYLGHKNLPQFMNDKLRENPNDMLLLLLENENLVLIKTYNSIKVVTLLS